MKNLEHILTELSSISNVTNDADAIQECDDLKTKLKEQQFYVVIVGLFKRGKSSVINALLGKALAPVAVTPVTAVITAFEYNANDSYANIRFKNGGSAQIPVSEVAGFISEDENPENKKQVSSVQIFDNSPLLQKLTLVDTPGLGYTFEHNTDTTLQFIPKIDAGLFVLSADMPVSKMDTDFLQHITEEIPHIIFVINKTDLLSKDDLQKIMQHNRKAVSAFLNHASNNIHFIPVSAKLGMEQKKESNIGALFNCLDTLADTHKQQLVKLSVYKRAKTLQEYFQAQIQLRLQTLRMPLHELEEKQLQMEQSMQLMQQQRTEFDAIIISKIKALQD